MGLFVVGFGLVVVRVGLGFLVRGAVVVLLGAGLLRAVPGDVERAGSPVAVAGRVVVPPVSSAAGGVSLNDAARLASGSSAKYPMAVNPPQQRTRIPAVRPPITFHGAGFGAGVLAGYGGW
jgi:hypothetical protein